MKRFIIYSQKASTSPKIGNLKSAGRIDVLLHSIISALFASHEFRTDVELHLILMGPPTSPRHITIRYHPDNTISKKDLKKLLEIALKKARENQTREVHPGVFVDSKSIQEMPTVLI
jgi:tRNA (pseudouridine54-N1)-methyltransferase